MNENNKKTLPTELMYDPLRDNLSQFDLVGRIVKKFEHKSVVLISLLCDGQYVPVALKQGLTNDYAQCKEFVGLGDIVGASGDFVKNRGGRTELQIRELRVIKKCEIAADKTGLLPEGRYTGYKSRQFYHTLMATDPMCTFLIEARSKMLHTFYNSLDEAGYINCTTPVLNHSFFAGGSRPFVTHMLDNNTDMYLRVTSEIALKHIIAGGLNKVYEIGNSFRNGSVNAMHNTPFMGAEIYQTYCTEPEHRELSIQLLKRVQEAVAPVFNKYGYTCMIDFKKPIPVMSFEEYIRSCGFPNFTIGKHETYPYIPEIGRYAGVEHTDAKLLYKWFKDYLIKKQISPVFISDQPSGISPLIARKGPGTLHRTYLVANGATLMEIAQSETNYENVIGELMAQAEQKGDGAYPCDYSSLIHAYRFGIPPMCSLFIGVDRLIPAMIGADSINRYKMYI